MIAGSDAGLNWRDVVANFEQRAADAHANSQPDQAMAALREARDVASKHDHAGEIWRRLTRQIANTCERIGDLDEACRYYEAAHPPKNALPDERYAWANGRALLAERRAEWELASALYREVVRLFPHLRTPGSNSLFGLSNAATWMAGCGESALAERILDSFQQALATRGDFGVTYELPMIEAEIARASGKLEAANLCWARVAEIARNTGQNNLLPSIAEERASILVLLGRRDEALALLRAHLPNDRAQPYDLSHMAAAIALGAQLTAESADHSTRSESRAILRGALCTESARGMPEAEWRILSSFAELAASEGQYHAAILFGKAAVAIIASLNQAAPPRPAYIQRDLTERLRPFRQLVSRLVEAGRFPEAARIQAAMKEETVFDLARRDDQLDVRITTIPLRPAEEALLATYRERCAQVRQAHSALHRETLPDAAIAQAETNLQVRRMEVSAWADHVMDGLADPVRPPEHTEAIAVPEGAGHLHFFHLGEIWRAYLRTASSERSYDVGHAREIAHMTFDLRGAIIRPTDQWRPVAAALFDRLLRPIDDAIKELARLRITADRPISYMPFAALHDGQQFLNERVALSVGTGIARTQRTMPQLGEWRILLLGSTGAGVRTIAHVEDEMRGIASAQPAAKRIMPFTVQTLSNELAAGAEIVHFASHFHLEPARPDRSYLALDGEEKLTLGNLRSGDFNLSQTELLVLSACETAVEDSGDFGLESLAGLARAKGARHVMGTLWPVADASAARLMTLFYAEAFKGAGEHLSWAACLRRAQLALMRETASLSSSLSRAGGLSSFAVVDCSHPYHWAGYVLYD